MALAAAPPVSLAISESLEAMVGVWGRDPLSSSSCGSDDSKELMPLTFALPSEEKVGRSGFWCMKT